MDSTIVKLLLTFFYFEATINLYFQKSWIETNVLLFNHNHSKWNGQTSRNMKFHSILTNRSGDMSSIYIELYRKGPQLVAIFKNSPTSWLVSKKVICCWNFDSDAAPLQFHNIETVPKWSFLVFDLQQLKFIFGENKVWRIEWTTKTN